MKILSLMIIFLVSSLIVGCDDEKPGATKPTTSASTTGDDSNDDSISAGPSTETLGEGGESPELGDFTDPIIGGGDTSSGSAIDITGTADAGIDSADPFAPVPVSTSGTTTGTSTAITTGTGGSGSAGPDPITTTIITGSATTSGSGTISGSTTAGSSASTLLADVKALNSGKSFYTDLTMTGSIGDHIVGGVDCPTGYSQLRIFTDCTQQKCQGHRKLCERKFKFDDINSDAFNVIQDVRILKPGETCGEYGYERTFAATVDCVPNSNVCKDVRLWCASRKTIKEFAAGEKFISDLYITPTDEKNTIAVCPAGYQNHITVNGKSEQNWFTNKLHSENNLLNSKCQKMEPLF